MTEHIETIIIGGGQAGLSVSYYLKQQGREHAILEQSDRAAPVWHKERWDSFTLVTPNWTVQLPGGSYQGADRNGFMGREEIVQFFDRYVEQHRLPVRTHTRVLSVEQEGDNYRVQTEGGLIRAHHVVIATGFFQKPRSFAFAQNLPGDILQLTSAQYRNPQSLPPGAVLVVGSGQSGMQIADELYQMGRKVYLCVSGVPLAPRRYRGKDIVEWLTLSGFFDRTADKLPSPEARISPPPAITGRDGGRSLDLHQFARDGVTLMGRLSDARDGKIYLAPDLYESLARSDERGAELLRLIDNYIEKNHLDAPQEVLPKLRDGFESPILENLDLNRAEISTVIWAMGFTHDYSLVKMRITDRMGFPVTRRGVTTHRGLYFIGMPWLVNLKSGFLMGVGSDAVHIAATIGAKDLHPSGVSTP